MIAYAETSGVLAWLLGEADGVGVADLLRKAARVVASPLTGVEASRALVRAMTTGRLSAGEELAARALLVAAERSWITLALDGRVLDRARTRFPHEPVRTLDALHLATAMQFHEALGAVTMVSLDQRIRAHAGALGFEVAPAEAG